MTKFRRQVIAACLLVLPSSSLDALAQGSELPPTIDCLEVVHAQPNDTLTGYTTKQGQFAVTFSLQSNGKYAMIGNQGSAELTTVHGDGFVQFIEKTPLGGVNLTTVLTRPNGDFYQAVHSRHPVIAGQLAMSQTVLSCRRR